MTAKFQDIADHNEDDRIAIIAQALKTQSSVIIAVCTDDIPGKPERYIAKLKAKIPNLIIMDQLSGPIPGVITIRVRLPEIKVNQVLVIETETDVWCMDGWRQKVKGRFVHNVKSWPGDVIGLQEANKQLAELGKGFIVSYKNDI